MSFSDDLDDIFDDWDAFSYTENAYPHKSSKTICLKGVFGYQHVEINGLSSHFPTILTKTSNLPNIANSDNVTIDVCVLDASLNGKKYIVREYESSGDGLTLLILEDNNG